MRRLLPLALLAALIPIRAAASELVLDDFPYTTADAARAAWKAAEGTPPVELIEPGQPDGLKILAPFAAQPGLRRIVVDRDVHLDLSAPGEFTLEVATDAPGALAELTFYFRSGDGWYTARGLLRKQAWQTLRFSKTAFRTEGTPAGWHRIDGVRIAAWRGRAENAWIAVRRLAAVSHDVALVIPTASAHAGDPELRTALDTADRLAGMLGALGLGSDAIEEAAVAKGALGKRRVAVLAYNPRLDPQAAAALERFVESGGKLLVCYQLSPRLGRLLGFANPQYARQQQPGDFAEIRFDGSIPGLPKSVRQASWNITTAEPAGHSARVIGHWHDDDGKPSGHAAMLVSDRGAFFSHIFLADNPQGKQQLLAAVLGQMEPPLWKQMARHALDRAAEVGHCSNWQDVSDHVRLHGDATAVGLLESANKTRALAVDRSGQAAYTDAVASANRAHALLAEAYLRAQPSPTREGRAVWNHSGTGAYAGDWDRSAKELAAAGFNMVLPNMLWAGQAHYASDVLPRSATYRRYGDQIAQCTAAAKRHGLEVHVWKVNYNLSGAPAEFVDRLGREGRLQVTFRGETQAWLCPSHPANRQLEVESMLEVARKYPVDGLHFDYIRYPGSDTCYCDGCRERFEAASGRRVADWPAECHSGGRKEEYNTWRCKQITTLVAAVHRMGKQLRPELMISAAVFGSYPACRGSVAQDWPKWVEAGYLDFVCPMDYPPSDTFFTSLIENQKKLVGGRIPIYPGIGATASNSTLSADRVVGQIHHARRLGTSGFTIFNFHRTTAESIIPGVGLGAGAQKAVPPHKAAAGGRTP